MKNLIRTIATSPKVSLKPYGSKFQQKYPKLYRLVSVLKNGTTRFTKETFSFLKFKFHLWKDPNYLDLMTWKDIEVYRQIPRDWKKVAPVMIISAFPFLNYIVLPIAYVYPHKLLCGQFWTLEQHLKFGEFDYFNKVKIYRPILDSLASHADMKLVDDSRAKNILIDLIDKIKNGYDAKVEEVLELKPILNKPVFDFKNLTIDHLLLLVRLDNCQRVFSLRAHVNLAYYAYWLRQSDKKLINQDLNKLPIEHIYNLCFERGINARSHSIDDLKMNLKFWFDYSNKLFLPHEPNDKRNQENFTLYLHSKILLKPTLNRKTTN